MFWGLIIEPGKRYSQTVDESFHVSKATLDLSSATTDDITLMLDHEGQEYILCHLNKTNKQESLDLNFQMGDSISFFSQGQSAVHLSGYHLDDMEEDDMTLGDMMGEEGEEEEDEDEEVEEEQEQGIADLRDALQAKAAKRARPETNGKNGKKAAKVMKMETESSEDEDDDEDEDGEEEEEEVKPPPKSKKQLKKERAQEMQKKPQQPAGQQQQQQQKKGAQPNAPAAGGAEVKAAAAASPKKQTLPGGLVVEDLKVGNGPAAKAGDQISVYYAGRLQKSGKQFDQCNKGKGFSFKLGGGRVIKGWDLGVVGMKLGGKRKLTIPASLAYGAGGSPPQIPPNATLVFDIELKALN